MTEINPVEFGRLQAEVQSLRGQVSSMQTDIRTLLEMANKSKGGLWAGMTLASAFGGVVAWIGTHWGGK